MKIRTTKSVSVSSLQPGDFISFRYPKDSGMEDRTAYVLYHDPESGLVHGLDGDVLDDEGQVEQVAAEMAEIAGQKEAQDQLRISSGILSHTRMPDNGGELWYNRHHRQNRFNDRPYRTFSESKITDLKLATPVIR